jgi:hypothetical protein
VFDFVKTLIPFITLFKNVSWKKSVNPPWGDGSDLKVLVIKNLAMVVTVEFTD